jgi:hypothetical protein
MPSDKVLSDQVHPLPHEEWFGFIPHAFTANCGILVIENVPDLDPRVKWFEAETGSGPLSVEIDRACLLVTVA